MCKMPRNKSGNGETGDLSVATLNSPIATVDRAGIFKFEGTKYDSWKFRLNELFISEHLTEALEPKKKEILAESSDFKKKNSRCLVVIIGSLANSHLVYANNTEYAYEILEMLDKVYLEKGTASRVYLKRRWQNLKMENRSLDNHLRKFDELTTELRQCGVELEEQDIIDQLLMSLLESYSVTVEVLEANLDLTLEKVKSKLRN